MDTADTTMILLPFLVLLVYFALKDRTPKQVDRRITRLERKVDLLLERADISEADLDRELQPDLGRVTELLRNGKRIQAIKVYRKITGAHLVEAKNSVERMAGER